MLTLATWPKPFAGRTADAQRNAIQSWTQLRPNCQVLLFGDEPGIAEAARDFGVEHVPDVARNEFGTALLDDLLAEATARAHHPTLCLVNTDVILLDDLTPAVAEVSVLERRFLLTGRCRELEVNARASPAELIHHAAGAKLREPGALDYLVFSRDLYAGVPPFALGRAGFDNWLVWRARDLGALVVDATAVVIAIHQQHGYGHLNGGRASAYAGPEAQRNVELAGGWLHLYNVRDAGYRLTQDGLRRNWRGVFRTVSVIRRARLRVGRTLRRYRMHEPGRLLP